MERKSDPCPTLPPLLTPIRLICLTAPTPQVPLPARRADGSASDLDASLIHEARPGYGEPPAPFYASPDSTLRLYQADALDLLRRMRGESVDMVFADPPYFLSNGGITCVGGRMVKVDKGGWDKSAGHHRRPQLQPAVAGSVPPPLEA